MIYACILVEQEVLQTYIIIRSVQFMSVRIHIFRILIHNHNNSNVFFCNICPLICMYFSVGHCHSTVSYLERDEL
jgi:hypothetical protein